MRAAAAILLACALGACAPRLVDGEAARTRTVTVAASTVRLEYLPQDEGAARDVAQALQAALPIAERWGALRTPVTITIHPTHEALEEAAHRQGYPWLRAWARYATVDLQSPRTWSLLFGPDPQEVEELLAHELTHCVMYQRATSEWSWQLKKIPLWFREGMASVTAGQGHRRSGPEAIRTFYTSGAVNDEGSAGGARPRAPARGDPLTDPDPLYRSDSELVYDTAHVAFQFLLDRYGDERVARVVGAMGAGDEFGPAFERGIVISQDAFGAEFRRYISWKGWAK